MLLSLTIDTTHPDARDDARTAIKLLLETFNLPADSIRVFGGVDYSVATPDSEVTIAAEARGEGPLCTPAHEEKAAAPQPLPPVLSSRALIPGTGTYVPVDINGLPWDKRIHASSQGRTADGSWRRKPKVPDAEFERVAAELRGIMSAPAAEVAEDTPPPVSPAEAFAQPPVAHAAPVKEPMDFAAFATWAGSHVHHQRLKYADMERVMREIGLVNAEGVGSFALLAHRPDMIPSAHERLSALIAAEDSP